MNTDKNNNRLDNGLYEIDGQVFCELSERDFYPPSDERCYVSYVEDIDGDMSFYEYSEWFWEEYGYELYDDIDM